MQIVTAGVLIRALYRPLSRRSLFPTWRPAVTWRLPTLQGALNFVAYAGPICGVLICKVIIYGTTRFQIGLYRQGGMPTSLASACWRAPRMNHTGHLQILRLPYSWLF